ncbi:BZ3500_MvSof-1268-A1-R1_Chr12-2g03879 [Microbotryum saponariae]|uniref:BZ3500_MvSof-1268-A1-R1_Chr12-2g03879 protein n=1 Tax=Microbotryum saponariae TaxID=289078 RepID=A0A2X0KND1_9BASI|nr:BZ3500_MvSof-1268-A1-R1_Chr12-2g03879 [Microbotryum saponariae]
MHRGLRNIYRTMSSTSAASFSSSSFSTVRSPVLNHLLAAVERLTPLQLAGSWDNVGVMIEAPYPRQEIKGKKQVLTCIDPVTEEALSSSSTAAVLTYHPPIFSGLKSMTLAVPLQASLLRLSAQGIPVVCIHTASDSSIGGVNDHIASAFTSDLRATSKAIEESKEQPEGHEGCGLGRLVTLDHALDKDEVVKRIKDTLNLEHVQAAWAPNGAEKIKTIAICAGSGSSVLSGVKADLYLSGEFDHHATLLCNAKGIHVILTNHSASERPWLKPFAPRLAKAMNEEAGRDEYAVLVSKADIEPLSVV